MVHWGGGRRWEANPNPKLIFLGGGGGGAVRGRERGRRCTTSFFCISTCFFIFSLFHFSFFFAKLWFCMFLFVEFPMFSICVLFRFFKKNCSSVFFEFFLFHVFARFLGFEFCKFSFLFLVSFLVELS